MEISYDVLKLENEEKNSAYIFEVVIEPDENVYHAFCPTLRGCHTWGHTKAEAFEYAKEAVILYLKSLIADKYPIPGIGIVKSIENLNPVIVLKDEKISKVAVA
jgi:predicted RNase H-like HicB family nuclease